MPPLLWQVQGKAYLPSLLLVNKLGKKISNLHSCMVFLNHWLAKPAGVRDYQHRKTNVIFHHILSLNTLQLMNI